MAIGTVVTVPQSYLHGKLSDDQSKPQLVHGILSFTPENSGEEELEGESRAEEEDEEGKEERIEGEEELGGVKETGRNRRRKKDEAWEGGNETDEDDNENVSHAENGSNDVMCE